MTTYQRKPNKVEARQIDHTNYAHIEEWLDRTTINYAGSDIFLVGDLSCRAGQWIVKYSDRIDIMDEKDFFEEFELAPTDHDDDYLGYVELPHVEIEEMVDNPDGSSNIIVNADIKTMRLFASIGLQQVLIEAAQKVIDEQIPMEEKEEDVGC